MLPILQIGPLAMQTPGLLLLIGLWLGLSLTERYAPQRGIGRDRLYNLIFIALIAGLAGARLTYVLRFPAAFTSNWLSVVSLNPGLLDPWGGLAAGAIAALIYAQRKEMPLLVTLDALTPLLAVMAIAIPLADLASGAAFGAPANLPWSIDLWGARRHPVQIYTALAAGLILFILWPGRQVFLGWPPSRYFLTFVALSAVARLLLEGLRGDSLTLPGGFRLAQAGAWLILALCLWALRRLDLQTA
jgi:phosphatidylglycerol---prolipoprotein diacylglyceryl transferase